MEQDPEVFKPKVQGKVSRGYRLTTRDLCKMFNRDRGTVYRWTREGLLPPPGKDVAGHYNIWWSEDLEEHGIGVDISLLRR